MPQIRNTRAEPRRSALNIAALLALASAPVVAAPVRINAKLDAAAVGLLGSL